MIGWLSESFLSSAMRWPSTTQKAVLTGSHRSLDHGCHSSVTAGNKPLLLEPPELQGSAVAAHTTMSL